MPAGRPRKWPTVEEIAVTVNSVLDGDDDGLDITDLTRAVSREHGLRDRLIPHEYVRDALQIHRRELSSEHSALIVVTDGRVWLYKLSDDPDETRFYVDRQLRGINSRLITNKALADYATRITNGRTAEGKKARMMNKFIGRVIEDTAEYDEVIHGARIFV